MDQNRNPMDQSLPRISWRILVVIVLATLLFLSVLGFSFRTGHHMVTKYTPLIDAAMEIRLEATLAHLWLEEILSGDDAESIDGVLQHIDNALWYARAMIFGGKNHEGDFQSLDHPGLRDEIHQVIEQLVLFRNITVQRYAALESAGVGSALDKRFDKTFRDFSERADRVESELQQLIRDEVENFRLLQILLTGFCALLAGLIFVLFLRYEKQRADHLNQIYAINRRLEQLAETDGLTGIPNRRLFDERLQNEWRRVAREGSPLTLAMIDVDEFKRYNDHYGHLRGDACLKAIAQLLAQQCNRPADLVARYGGEEFAVILQGGGSMHDFMERLRRSVEQLQIPHEASAVSEMVTVSIGYCSTTGVTGVEPTGLLQLADQALYRAKQRGRNRVEEGSCPIPAAERLESVT